MWRTSVDCILRIVIFVLIKKLEKFLQVRCVNFGVKPYESFSGVDSRQV